MLLSLGALIVAALFLFPYWWPLVAGRPALVSFPGVSDEERAALETVQAIDPTEAAAVYIAGTPTTVPEDMQAMPDMELPIILARGEFQELDALHWATGTVTLFRSGSEVIIVFENFSARNGPDLYVLLSVHAEPRTSAEVHQGAGAVEVGPLVGSVGAQSYTVPESVDIALYNSVVIYSRAFDTIFSVAPLTPEEF